MKTLSPALQAAVASYPNPVARQTLQGLVAVVEALRSGPAHEGLCLTLLSALEVGFSRAEVDRLLIDTARLSDEDLEATLIGKLDNVILYLHVQTREPIYLGADFQPIPVPDEPWMTVAFSVGAITRNLRRLSADLAASQQDHQ